MSLFPIPTLVFSIVCGYLIYSAVEYKPQIAAAGLVILLAGLPIYWFTCRKNGTVDPTDEPGNSPDTPDTEG